MRCGWKSPKQDGQNLGGRVLKGRFHDLPSGLFATATSRFGRGDWRPQTAKEKMAQIEFDLIDKFGDQPLDSFTTSSCCRRI